MQKVGKPSVIFVLGGPGSGKGTVCEKLVQDFKYGFLSAGELLREERKSGSKDGVLIEQICKEGKIVPSEITVGLLKKGMEKNGWNRLYLIDGFPRGMENYTVWEKLMGSVVDFKFTMQLDCPVDVMIERVMKRAQSSNRFDDTPEVLKKRLVTHEETSKPVLDEYEKRKQLVRINANQAVDAVYKDVVAVIKQKKLA